MWKDILNARVFYLPAHPGGRLLEIGCGNGNSLKFLQQIGWCVTGLDFDSEAVANAKTKGLDVHLGQLKDQRFPDATFDAIVMSHVIEHVQRPRELLRACHRVLKKNGTLVVLTPNAEGFLHKYHQDSWRGLEPPRHLQIFTPRALEKISMDSGFRQNKLLTSMNGHIYINLASMEIAKKTRHDMQRQYPLMHRIPIHVGAFFLSWWKTLFRKYAGDEIVLIAHKESHTATNHAPSHSQ
jgi:SAM-dependent methyltransferase